MILVSLPQRWLAAILPLVTREICACPSSFPCQEAVASYETLSSAVSSVNAAAPPTASAQDSSPFSFFGHFLIADHGLAMLFPNAVFPLKFPKPHAARQLPTPPSLLLWRDGEKKWRHKRQRLEDWNESRCWKQQLNKTKYNRKNNNAIEKSWILTCDFSPRRTQGYPCCFFHHWNNWKGPFSSSSLPPVQNK